jgi:cellulose synthase/poly-beta-1,6-N-acetylglucosamine synthase-like glycosyltransferase
MVYMTVLLRPPTIPGTDTTAEGWHRRLASFRERRGSVSPMMQTTTRTLVATCTYNERENIGELIAAILENVPDAHVLVVDDDSPDGTGKLVDECAAENTRVHVIHRAGKLGLGSAILEALRYAIEQDYDFMVNMDADARRARA